MDLNSIIIPPVEIRNIIDKTSSFVAKNGPVFEERIYERERHNPKFSFLNPNDPYHKYYQVKTEDYKTGSDRASQLVPKEQPAESASATTPAKERVLKSPEPFEFRVPHPPISPLDLDIMKCAALFVARNGRQFLSMLSVKEQKNVQFDFLKPSNILFSYFNKLVEMYTKIMQFPASLTKKLEVCTNKFALLDLLMERVEYEAWKNTQRAQEDARLALEQKNLASLINWQEFIVVENLELPASDDIEAFELPMSIHALKALSLREKSEAFAGTATKLDEALTRISSNPEAPITAAYISQDKIKTTSSLEPIGATPVKQERCPVCKKMFLASEISAHIKQELANPLATEPEKAKEELAHYDFIGQNLSNFMKQATREDSSNAEISTVQEHLVWDGTMESANAVARAAQIQTNQIYQSMKVLPSPIGPPQPNWGIYPTAPPSSSLATCLTGPPPSGLAICPMGPPQSFDDSGNNQPLLPLAPMSNVVPNLPSTIPALPEQFPPQLYPPIATAFPVGTLPNLPSTVESLIEHDAKKQKSWEDSLMPVDKFLELYPNPITLNIQLPDASTADKPEWNFDGKIIQLSCTPKESIQELKMKIQNLTGIPVPRQKLFTPNLPPLKNQLSIAYYNLLDSTCLALHLKERGGRR